mgnify:CR=1 FL=1
MTDEQIKQRVAQILNILHDPKIGFNGLFNDVKEEYLAELRKKIDRNKEPERYVAERDKLLAELRPALEPEKQKKVKEMAIALDPEMAHKGYTEHKFALTGESIMKNRLYVSCGNAAKAFYYVDQHLSDYIPGAQNGLLDTQIMFSTDPEHLIDGMSGHTLPCIKMSDGKYHALDPQIPVDKKNPQLPLIQDEIVVGGQINHILPSIAEKGRPYKIMKIVSPQELESTYLSFENFIRDTTEHKGKTAELCNRLVVLLNKLNLGQYRGNAEMAYHLAKETQNSELPLDIVVYQRKTGELTVFPRIELEGKWYDFRMDASWLKLDRHDTDPKSEFSLQAPDLTFQQKLSLMEYITAYEQLVAERAAEKKSLMNGISKTEQRTLQTQGINLPGHVDFKPMFAHKKIPTPAEIEQTRDKILDIRSKDCRHLNLSIYTAEQISFDDQTVFPSDPKMLPQGFDIKHLRDTFKFPGLNIHQLHKRGIDGSGVAIAIIDTRLAPHTEYNNNLAHYEEFVHYKDHPGEMHGSAVASIAVGKTVGVAPKAKLFYFAADLSDGQFTDDETRKRTSKFYAAALNRIIEINKTLPDNEKIAVVSVSASPSLSRDPEIWALALQEAKNNGIFVTTTNLREEYNLADNGLYRDINGDINNPLSYSKPIWYNSEISQEQQRATLAFPMDHRTTASPTGNNEYVHYASGGWSWMKPFEAGMYALAKQVDRTITPERFWELGLQTGTYTPQSKSVVINPVALVDKIQELALARDKQQIIAAGSYEHE